MQMLQGGYSYVYNLGSGCHAYRPDDPHIFLSKRIEDAFSVPFEAGQNDVRAAIHYDHVHELGVNSVWGTIGVGKSAIVRFSYYAEIAFSLGMTPEDDIPMKFRLNRLFSPELCTPLFERFGWVDVPDPFDLAEFSRRLLLDFHSSYCEEMETAAVGIIQGHDPIQGCYGILRKAKCLVVVDGLRSAHEWDMIREAFLCQTTTECSVVVITTEESVARHCVDKMEERMINVRALEDKAAVDLFEKITNKELTSSKLENAKDIVAKCGGLPKIIAAVGQASSSFWENTNDDLVVKLHNDPQFHHLNGLLSWMHSYFDACSDSVKPCIFYLSVFPTKCQINRGRLLRRWIAEGYSRDTVGRTAKDNAERLFCELVDLGIIQQPASNSICQVNGFFREYIISQPMEDNLVFALEGHCKMNSQRTGQHLTIMENWDRKQQNVFESIDVARLRSLTVFGKWKLFFISDKMTRIRVLDLEGTLDVTDGDLEDIFWTLLTLKFICLRGCRNITCLPNSLGGLRQLETLDVRHTSIVALPSAIRKLKKVQYIRVGTSVSSDEDWTSSAPAEDNDATFTIQPASTATPEGSDARTTSPPQAPEEYSHGTRTSKLSCSMQRTSVTRLPKFPLVNRRFCGLDIKSQQLGAHNVGVEVPAGIGNMDALHTLGVVNINSARGNVFLRELTNLTQLLKLRVCGINQDNWKRLCSALSDHGHLESLSVRFDEDCLDGSFKPPKTLKSLKLHGPIHELPVCIKELVNLKKLDLEMTISRQEDMDSFSAALPHEGILRRLCIKPTQQVVRSLDFSSSDDRIRPRVLKVDCSSSLEVKYGDYYMVDIHVLIVHCSSGSSFRVSGRLGLNLFRDLQTVYLKGSYHDELKEYLQQQVRDHDAKPVLKIRDDRS